MPRLSGRGLRRTAVAALAAWLLLLAVTSVSLAQTFDEQIEGEQSELEKVEKQRQEAQAFLDATKARRSGLQSRLKVIEEARYREIGKLQELQRQVEVRELDIFEGTRQVKALESDFDAEKQILGSKLRALYKASRGVSVLELVLSSSSFTEALDKVVGLQAIVRQDIAGIRQLGEKREEIRIRGLTLASQLSDVELLRSQQEQPGRERRRGRPPQPPTREPSHRKPPPSGRRLSVPPRCGPPCA